MSRNIKYTDEEKMISNRYSSIKSRVAYDLQKFWPREKFINWYKNKPKICCYCQCTDIELKKFYELKYSEKVKRVNRGQSLEIERKKDIEYTEENCELSCYWCNNAKSDVFTYDEFKYIGLEIGKIIKSKIKLFKD